MQFRDTWIMLFDGTKTQTRRIAKPDDRLEMAEGGSMYLDEYIDQVDYWTYHGIVIERVFRADRLMWEVGRRYSIQPGRGLHRIGSFLLPTIRCQWLQDITENDARAEGAHAIEWTETIERQVSDSEFVPMPVTMASHRYGFQEIWTGLWQGTPYDWDQNPIVYPLGIAEVKRNE